MQKGTKSLLFLIAGIIMIVYSIVALVDPSYAKFNFVMPILGIFSIVFSIRLKYKK